MSHLLEVVMISLWLNNKLKISVILILLCMLIIPSLIWCEGYQEEKLFDKNFYSAEQFKKKIESYNDEIQIIDDQIQALETDIDWLVLKINQIQDSGRAASLNQKETITKKENKINALLKNRKRLESMVQNYSASLAKKKKEKLSILKEKEKSSDTNKQVVEQKEAKIETKNIVPQSLIQQKKEKQADTYNQLSKAELQAAIKSSGLSDWVEIVGTKACLKMETTLPILFPAGSAKVANEYKSFFEKLADFLKPYDIKVFVNGYADKVPMKSKKYPSNFELGATRAANIVHQLVSYGLKPSIFTIESTGEHRVAAKGISTQKALERKAEVTIIFLG